MSETNDCETRQTVPADTPILSRMQKAEIVEAVRTLQREAIDFGYLYRTPDRVDMRDVQLARAHLYRLLGISQ